MWECSQEQLHHHTAWLYYLTLSDFTGVSGTSKGKMGVYVYIYKYMYICLSIFILFYILKKAKKGKSQDVCFNLR